jgi:5-hydroxyisourate hydrolase-like protein (transthyretin family)
MNRLFFVLFFILLGNLSALPARAESGAQGRVAWRGELVPGVRVHAYHSIPDIAFGKAVAVSSPSEQDGTYRLLLSPGDYYLTARDYNGSPVPGKHFCYYSGAPVRVTEGVFTNVGFNLVRIPAEDAPTPGETSGIRGEISFQDEPLEQCYLYVYKDPSKDFKGPAYFVQPVAKGDFRLRLPPGDYYLLARKRAKGGQYGPIEIGDHFNYYYGNPVRIEAGQTREVRIETITRLSMLEEGENNEPRRITGKLLDPEGKPAAGLRVLAYRQSAMTGTPDILSAPTGGDGRFELPLPDDGPWYLLAREHLGGPAEAGEQVGRHGGGAGKAISLKGQKILNEVTIHVARKTDP